MADSIIGAPLSKDVHDQILIRQQKARSPQRDNNTLFFLNSNNAWVKLSSGADTIPEEGDFAGDPTLAKENMLGFTQNKAGIGSLYKETASRGYRPVPGIREVSIKSKGTYGTLRETDVSFVVWSLEDLDTLELVYLRPGFSMLLEWGHTCYFNNAGEFRTASSTINDFFTKYTSTGDKSTQQIVQEKIQKLREESSYNYDALFGYVKNFSWSFRKDGGYDCTISIASVGSLIEGLRADIGLQNIPGIAELLDRSSIDELKDTLKSPFHFIFEQLTEKGVLGLSGAVGKRVSQQVLKFDSRPQISQFFNKLKIYDFTYVYGRSVAETTFAGLTLWTQPVYWMHLSMVFDIINTFFTLRNKNGKTVELYSGVQDTVKTGPYQIASKYITSKYHFSLDPFRVHLPLAPEIPSGITDLPADVQKYLGKIPSSSDIIVQGISGGSFSNIFGPPRGERDDILNITVSSIVLKELFDRNLEEPDSQNRDLKSLLDNLASILTDNLGGINEFAFHFDETRSLFILVDRKNTPTEKTVTQFPVITLTGLNSLVDNISLSSKLSNRVGTQIAIAAQGSSDNYQENVSEILKWNEGVVDRHGVGGTYDVGDSTTSADPAGEQYARKRKWLELAANAYEWNGSGETYSPATFAELKAYHRIYTADYALEVQQLVGEAEKGIIPVELSFTMLGISGIDIAEAFKIDRGILPSKYYGRFGFIITGLEHEIGTRWRTTLRTQFYILEPPSEERKAQIKARLNPAKPAGYVNIFTGGARPGGGGNTGGRTPAPARFNGATPNADYLRTVLASLGYLDKGRLSEGGDLVYGMSRYAAGLFKRIKAAYPNAVITTSGGWDLWHMTLPQFSRHKVGRAVDFVVTPSDTATLDGIVEIIRTFMWTTNLQASYIDEYRFPSPHSTGVHFHISWMVEGDRIESRDYFSIKKKGPAPLTFHPDYYIS